MLAAELLPSPTLCFLLSLPVLCLTLPIRWVLRQEWPTLRQSLYFPVVGQVRNEHQRQRARLLRRIGGVDTTVITADNRKVHCVWAPTDEARTDGPVVLLLHANAMVLDDMVDWAVYYLQLRVSVMMVTFWGQPTPHTLSARTRMKLGCSQSTSLVAEATLYLDAEAALSYVQQESLREEARVSIARPDRNPSQPALRRVSCLFKAYCNNPRRFSVCLAIASLRMESQWEAPSPPLWALNRVQQVTVDQTFTSIYEVSVHVGRSLYDQLVLPRVP
ncbi:MAG: hypothetical protein SGPRY_003995, partial [Prymnesium sp.]